MVDPLLFGGGGGLRRPSLPHRHGEVDLLLPRVLVSVEEAPELRVQAHQAAEGGDGDRLQGVARVNVKPFTHVNIYI